MKTTKKNLTYIEWLSAEDMHALSKEWLSELNFIKDEHLFFEDLVTKFTSQLLATEKFADSKEIVDAINRSEKYNNQLIDAVKRHENQLYVMVDGVDQKEVEKAYTTEHQNLSMAISDFLKEYKSLKMQLYNIIKHIRKEEKTSHLLDRE